MPNSSPDEKQDNLLKTHIESDLAVEKSFSPPSQQDSSHCIVDTSVSMAGFTVAAPQGEVQEHDSFDSRPQKVFQVVKPPIETRGPRPPKVARHVADGGSEFPNKVDDATSTHLAQVSRNSASVASTPLRWMSSTSSSSAGLTQTTVTSRSNSSSLPVNSSTTTQFNRRLPSSSQHPNFAALFAARNSKIASIRALENETSSQVVAAKEDTNSMSVEKVLPDQQVKAAATAAAAASKNKAKRKRTPQRKSGQSSGRWTNEEHRAFLEGLKEFGREWKKVATRIPTRTSAQIRSHAQKYFAKLQRDQETSMNLSSNEGGVGILLNQEHAAAGLLATSGSPSTQASVPPSVQKNIERLMADPQAVQREVEHTLRALRDRYRQLQSQLERQQQRGHAPFGAPRKPVLLQQQQQQQQQPIVAQEEEEEEAATETSSVGSRKRTLQEMEAASNSSSHKSPQASHQEQDDHSSVTTNISASVASLGNEELIALHVLGGALPRNESSASLRTLPTVAVGSTQQESPASTKSTTTANK